MMNKRIILFLLFPILLTAQIREYNFNKGEVKIFWNDRDVDGKKYQHPGIVFNLYELDLNFNKIKTYTGVDTLRVVNLSQSRYFYVTAQNDFEESRPSDTILISISDIPTGAIQVPFSISGADLISKITFNGIVVIYQDTKMGIWGHVKETFVNIPIYVSESGTYIIALTGSGKVNLILNDEIISLELNRDVHRIERTLSAGAMTIKLHTTNQFILDNLEIRLKAGEVPGRPAGIGAEQ